MSDEPRLPQAVTYAGHQEGPETFHPIVFIVAPVRERAGKLSRTTKLGRRTVTCESDSVLKGTVISHEFAQFVIQYRGNIVRAVANVEATYPTRSFSLKSLLGAPVHVQEEFDSGQA